MNRLFYTVLAFMLLMLCASCRLSQAEKYQRYLEEKNDTTFEYINEPADSVVEAEAEEAADGAAGANDDGLIAVPDIPDERPINMSADDYEVKKAMSGKN